MESAQLGKWMVILSCLLMYVGCVEDKKSAGSSTANTTGTTTPNTSATISTSVKSFNDLALSKTLSGDIPDALDAQTRAILGDVASDTYSFDGSVLAASTEKRSSEACQVGQTTTDTYARLSEVKKPLCHIEALGEKVALGKKYSISYTNKKGNTSGSYGVWIDNSVQNQLTVHVCANGSLTQKITVQAADKDRSKGYFQSTASWANQTQSDAKNSISITGAFDYLYTDSTRHRVTMKLLYLEGTTSKYASWAKLNLPKTGATDDVNKIEVSESFSSSGTTSMVSYYALVNSQYGQMYRLSGGGTYVDSSGKKQVYNPSISVAQFDSSGKQISSSTTSAFGTGGALAMTTKDLPKLLPVTFAPEALGADVWNCVWEETLTFEIPDPSQKPQDAHVLCETQVQKSYSGPNCHEGVGYGTSITDDTFKLEELDTTNANKSVTTIDQKL